jgi:demethylmenaquinone methyltransferase/2-methoxy-6-polyprenyl-1,4-benzoquinol methylase
VAVALPSPAEKAAVVRAMFDRIAPRYDLLNAVMTWRLDRWWRRAAIEAAALHPGDVVVDVACGTGDLAALAAARGARVIGVDFAVGMLAVARARRVSAALVRADAAALPLGDAVADAVTCGFALRNFVAIAPVLAEMARVLRPAGRCVLLEVATPAHPVARFLHHLYLRRVVPCMGALLAERAAYRYLPDSLAYLPEERALCDMIAGAGFEGVSVIPLSMGAVRILRACRGESA